MAMTEQELAAVIPTWQMPPDVQAWTLYGFGAAAVVCLAVGIWLAYSQKSWMPLACFAAAVVTINLEPMIARVSGASHAQIGQITAFVSEGRAIPWHVLLVYTAYFGFGYYFLVPALEARKLAGRFIWICYLGFTLGAWVFELPFIKLGLWDYFGPQSWKPLDAMPVYFAFVNATSSFAACALLAATMPLLPGLGRLWIVLLGPAFTIGTHFAVAWPMYNLRTSSYPTEGSHAGAVVTIVLCLLSTHLVAKAFAPHAPA